MDEWKNALVGYVPKDILDNKTPKEIIIKALQNVDWKWRDEIEKYIPELIYMSFCGPEATIKWLMGRVKIL